MNGITDAKRDGMALVRGGEFWMGSEDFYPEEAPVRLASVADFWIDQRPVTNAEFARFVAATGHVTFAEKAPDPAQYPGMDPAMAKAGSAVFTPTRGPVSLNDPSQWWRFVFGADWRHPRGPDSSIERLMEHPVVQVAYEDVAAYAAWAGKALPTEAEWEFAARGGLDRAPYAWGEELEPGGRVMANTWRGDFPWRRKGPMGALTSKVGSFPPNGYGLYDMIGNVWEWTVDWYAEGTATKDDGCCGQPRARLAEEAESYDPANPAVPTPRKVLKGGSHLCAPSYCRRYRPAARHPQAVDSPTSHIGFRCVAPA